MFFFCDQERTTVLRLLCLCARLFICALWSPAGKGLTSWLSFVVSNCEFVTFPLVSWARCGTWLYRILILSPLLLKIIFQKEKIHFFSLTHTSLASCLWDIGEQCRPRSDATECGIGSVSNVCLFVFVALRPKSTAMVIAGRSVHLTTLFPGQAWTSG